MATFEGHGGIVKAVRPKPKKKTCCAFSVLCLCFEAALAKPQCDQRVLRWFCPD